MLRLVKENCHKPNLSLTIDLYRIINYSKMAWNVLYGRMLLKY